MSRSGLLNPWLVLPLVGVAAAVALAVPRARVPARAFWQAAADAARADLLPGDGVTWTPYWAGEARLALHDLPAFHLPDPAAADLARYDRVWLMGAFGVDADDLPAAQVASIDRRTFGRVTLDRVQVAGEKVHADLRAELEAVRVTRVRGAKSEACDFWDGIGWHCTLRRSPDDTRRCLATPIAQQLRRDARPGRRLIEPNPWARFCGLDAWINVSRDVRVIGEAPRRCVWYHPRAGETVRLAWPADAPRAERLVVDYGFTDPVTVARNTPSKVQPATLTARRGEATLGQRTLEAAPGWHRWTAPLAGEGPVVLEVTTSDHRDAHLCIDATLRGPR